MDDLNIYVILLNCAYITVLGAYTAKKMAWLRLLTIAGNALVLPYFLYFMEPPLWNSIFWASIYILINLVMLLHLYLESRPIRLSDLEQKIYDLTFKSLEPRIFKKLIDHGSLIEHQPGENLVTRVNQKDNKE